MSPLAVLPVFFDLRGKRVVVAGDGDGAVWKAELLAACGACVDCSRREQENCQRNDPAPIESHHGHMINRPPPVTAA